MSQETQQSGPHRIECECCGKPFDTTGKIYGGWRCDCDHFKLCYRDGCHKCRQHCECREGFLTFEGKLTEMMAEDKRKDWGLL